MLSDWDGNREPGGKSRQPTTGFMASVTSWLTVEDRDQLRKPTLVSSMRLPLPYLYHLYTLCLYAYALIFGLPFSRSSLLSHVNELCRTKGVDHNAALRLSTPRCQTRKMPYFAYCRPVWVSVWVESLYDKREFPMHPALRLSAPSLSLVHSVSLRRGRQHTVGLSWAESLCDKQGTECAVCVTAAIC